MIGTPEEDRGSLDVQILRFPREWLITCRCCCFIDRLDLKTANVDFFKRKKSSKRDRDKERASNLETPKRNFEKYNA